MEVPLTTHCFSCLNRADAATWEKMTVIKTTILKIWDTAAEGVRIACIKFAQRIIMVQTPGASDPRVRYLSDIHLVTLLYASP